MTNCMICGKEMEYKHHRTHQLCKKHESYLCLSEDFHKAKNELIEEMSKTGCYKIVVKYLKLFDRLLSCLIIRIK